MQNATRKSEPSASETARRQPVTAAKRAKLSVLLVTGDDTLWPQIGAHVGGDLVLKQLDSIDELLTATPAGLPAIVLWDARNQTDAAGRCPGCNCILPAWRWSRWTRRAAPIRGPTPLHFGRWWLTW